MQVEETKSDDDVKVVHVEAEVAKPLCEEVIVCVINDLLTRLIYHVFHCIT